MALGNALSPHDHAGGTPGDRRCRFALAARPDSVAHARRLTRHHLTGWAVPEETLHSAALVVSELVTNAVVHTVSNEIVCELRDDKDAARLRIAVRDEGCDLNGPGPHPARAGHEDHGRGLLLVDAISCAWGAQEEGLGLLVWAELSRGPERAREREAGAACA